jgi:FkbM family methyltransferase
MNIDNIRTLVLKHPFLMKLVSPAVTLRRLFLRRKSAKFDPVFEGFTSALIEDPIIRVSNIPGKFAVDSRSSLFRRTIIARDYEPELVECVSRYVDKKRDAIDVGANVGFFTVLLATNIQNGVVLAIEPTPGALKRLKINLVMNGYDRRTIVFEGVVSNMVGTKEILSAQGKEEYSTLGSVYHPLAGSGPWEMSVVLSSTIDELCSYHRLDPGFIKIDVEGAEHLVLEGAKRVLRQNRPVILSELNNYLLTNNGSSALQVVDFLRKYDYEVIDPIHPSVPPGRKECGDILCLPR